MNRTHLFALGLCLLTACFEKADDDEDDGDGGDGGGSSMTEEAFLSQYVDFVCEWALECGLSEVFGDSVEECRAELGPQIEATFGPGGDCTYDAALGPACLAEIEDYFSSCEPDSTESAAPSCEAMCDYDTTYDTPDTPDTGWDAAAP